MWRTALLKLSTNDWVRRFVTSNGLARRVASRFVAGETVEQAVAVARDLTLRRASVEMDYLGESVRDRAQAESARDAYLDVMQRLAAAGVDVQVSVKLTQMGLDVDEALCMEHLETIATTAEALHGFLWMDMEGSDYTERTVETYCRLRARHPRVGVALQAYLYRTEKDLRRLLAEGGTVRLCKGAYREPESVAFPSKRDVDRNFELLAELLLAGGTFQAIATHDEAMINHVRQFASARGIGPEMFEFQMLHGVRRDLQDDLIGRGYQVRVYVPYGEQWYPYLMRRLAERPANLFFLLGSLAREKGASRGGRVSSAGTGEGHKAAGVGTSRRVG